MEEARFLAPRLVVAAFVPQRISGEILAQAFERLTLRAAESSDGSSVQSPRKPTRAGCSKLMEVTR